MHSSSDTNAAAWAHLPVPRRALLRGGTAVGLTALTTAGLGSAPVTAAPAPRTQSSKRPDVHLVTNYQPSQPTGWPATPGQTFSMSIGGHVAAKDFTFNGKPHRVSLLPFGQSSDSPDPIYEDVPTDPDINFKQVLAESFGAYYSFHYVGGFPGRNEFNVQSYSVFVRHPAAMDPTTGCGAGLYVIYDPDVHQGDPAVHDTLQWIQVVRLVDAVSPPRGSIDNLWRANPWYMYGGLTSVHGDEVFNFHDVPQMGALGNVTLDAQFLAEVFLAEDTGIKDASGKAIIKIFGGIKWGWRVQEVR